MRITNGLSVYECGCVKAVKCNQTIMKDQRSLTRRYISKSYLFYLQLLDSIDLQEKWKMKIYFPPEHFCIDRSVES